MQFFGFPAVAIGAWDSHSILYIEHPQPTGCSGFLFGEMVRMTGFEPVLHTPSRY